MFARTAKFGNCLERWEGRGLHVGVMLAFSAVSEQYEECTPAPSASVCLPFKCFSPLSHQSSDSTELHCPGSRLDLSSIWLLLSLELHSLFIEGKSAVTSIIIIPEGQLSVFAQFLSRNCQQLKRSAQTRQLPTLCPQTQCPNRKWSGNNEHWLIPHVVDVDFLSTAIPPLFPRTEETIKQSRSPECGALLGYNKQKSCVENSVDL